MKKKNQYIKNKKDKNILSETGIGNSLEATFNEEQKLTAEYQLPNLLINAKATNSLGVILNRQSVISKTLSGLNATNQLGTILARESAMSKMTSGLIATDTLGTILSRESAMSKTQSGLNVANPLATILTRESAMSKTLSGLNATNTLGTILAKESGAWKTLIGFDGLNTLGTILAKEYPKINMMESLHSLQYVGSPNMIADISTSASYTHYAKKSLYSFAWNELGIAIGLNVESKKTIGESFLSLSTKYSKLIDSYQKYPSNYLSLPSSINKTIPIEYYTVANVLKEISNNDSAIQAPDSIAKEIQYENEYSLNSYLPLLHPGLLKMWKGAIETYYSTNTDRTRQFIVSIRELFGHLMHRLAPDEDVKNWTTDTTLFHDGKPTRKARLKYICRNIMVEPFNKFVEKDIQTTIEFITIFQQGTHSIDNDFTSSQLLAIKSKAESTLKFLLEIEFSINK